MTHVHAEVSLNVHCPKVRLAGHYLVAKNERDSSMIQSVENGELQLSRDRARER